MIIEDNCFIGARSEVAEGVIVRKGAVLSMGVFLGARPRSSTATPAKPSSARCRHMPWWCPATCRRATEERPARPVPACAVIVKRVDERTRSKTTINELLRD